MVESLESLIPANPCQSLDIKRLLEMGCPDLALPVVLSLNTPELLQAHVDTFTYNHDEDDLFARALPGVLETGQAHCFDGTVGFVLPILHLWGYHPIIVLIHAIDGMDVDHNVAIYRSGDHLGAVAMSSFPTLKGRPPTFPTLHSLMQSYYPFYTSEYPEHYGQLSMRGYTDPIDVIRNYGTEWFFRRGDQPIMNIYNTYTQGAICTDILSGKRYPYPEE